MERYSMPMGTPIAKEDWAGARRAIENGCSYRETSARFGIKRDTLKVRSYKEQWPSPSRRAKKRREATPSARATQLANGNSHSPPEKSGITEIRVSDLPPLPDLLAAANAGPEAYRNALRRWGQLTIAGAIPDIPPPRTLAELKTVADIIDKQDRKDGPGNGNTIRHASSLKRRAPIEAEVIPEVDGFRI